MSDSKPPRSVKIFVRHTPEARDLLEQIAVERGLVGGHGIPPGEPNVAATVRELLEEADPRFRAVALSMEWDRRPQ